MSDTQRRFHTHYDNRASEISTALMHRCNELYLKRNTFMTIGRKITSLYKKKTSN